MRAQLSQVSQLSHLSQARTTRTAQTAATAADCAVRKREHRIAPLSLEGVPKWFIFYLRGSGFWGVATPIGWYKFITTQIYVMTFSFRSTPSRVLLVATTPSSTSKATGLPCLERPVVSKLCSAAMLLPCAACPSVVARAAAVARGAIAGASALLSSFDLR